MTLGTECPFIVCDGVVLVHIGDLDRLVGQLYRQRRSDRSERIQAHDSNAKPRSFRLNGVGKHTGG